jgi:hypothetical protein
MAVKKPAEDIEQTDDEVMAEEANIRDQRKDQWGEQHDVWLIRKARKNKEIELMLSLDWPGVTEEGKIKVCPVRIDKHAIQVKQEGSEPFWVMKAFIVGFREVTSTT